MVVHAKIVVADDAVQFGTLNLDASALYRDFELGLIVEDAATAEMFESRVFEPDIARSHPGDRRAACGIAARRGCGTRSRTSSDHHRAGTYTRCHRQFPGERP